MIHTRESGDGIGVPMTRFSGTPSSFAPVLSADAAEQIEFGQVLELVAQRAVSQVGGHSVRRRFPGAAADAVQDELAAVGELCALLDRGDAFVPENIPDARPILERLAVSGSVLEGKQLSEVGQVVAAARNVAAQLRRVGSEAPRVGGLAVEPPPEHLLRRLSVAIGPDGGVQDGASSELADARRDLRATRSRLVSLLEDLMQDLSSAAAGGGVTLRSSRYVIPVRREARSKVKGIVHGESSTGATLFVEPHEAVQLGNDLNACEALESRVVIKVLRELTELVRAHVDRIEDGWRMCVAVDDLYARARYANDVGAKVPTVVPAPAAMVVRQGRHPLLLAELATVVPFDLDTEEGEPVVVVSGPNTGGKTVLLKAVGLIHAMAQSGIIPPVGEGTTLPVFGGIYADIGDHQSIAASLSTFSGHLEALKGVLEAADARSLVLLDEFGTGTDPSEGAALAGAVLKTLCDRGCTTIATTHLNQLKRLASETAGAVNASLQFDAEQLEPTYRVVKGIPGRSYGLAIARRLGFPPAVLQLAEQLQPDAERSFESLLGDLEEREKSLLQREESIRADAARLDAVGDRLSQLRADLAERGRSLEETTRQMETSGRAEARRFLLEARKRVEDAMALARLATDETTAKQARKLVEDGVRVEASALEKLEVAARKKGWKMRGRRGTETPAGAATSPPMVERPAPPSTLTESAAASEIDLRGMLGEDAEDAVVRALDEAVVADLASLRIIHGKGTGALRHRVCDVLRRDRRVASFSSPPAHQGGWGVTVAELQS